MKKNFWVALINLVRDLCFYSFVAYIIFIFGGNGNQHITSFINTIFQRRLTPSVKPSSSTPNSR